MAPSDLNSRLSHVKNHADIFYESGELRPLDRSELAWCEKVVAELRAEIDSLPVGEKKTEGLTRLSEIEGFLTLYRLSLP